MWRLFRECEVIMRNDLLYCQSSILKNAPPPPNMVAPARLLQRNFEHLIVIKTNICCIGTSPHLSSPYYQGNKPSIWLCNGNWLWAEGPTFSKCHDDIKYLIWGGRNLIFVSCGFIASLWYRYVGNLALNVRLVDTDLGETKLWVTSSSQPSGCIELQSCQAVTASCGSGEWGARSGFSALWGSF